VIRINLLPRKKKVERTAEVRQTWLVVLLVLLLVEVSCLFGLHSWLGSKLKEQEQKNAQLTDQIDQSKRAVANHPEVIAKLEQLRAKEDAISKLQSARTGPTAVLLELAHILTPGKGPTVDAARLDELRRENPLALYNPGWDPRRLWLKNFSEDKRSVKINGVARDGEDVSEFARRLNLSNLFFDVQLLPGKRIKDEKFGLELVNFELQAKVRY
jgi:type IV pilus assembly protein PilN